MRITCCSDKLKLSFSVTKPTKFLFGRSIIVIQFNDLICAMNHLCRRVVYVGGIFSSSNEISNETMSVFGRCWSKFAVIFQLWPSASTTIHAAITLLLLLLLLLELIIYRVAWWWCDNGHLKTPKYRYFQDVFYCWKFSRMKIRKGRRNVSLFASSFSEILKLKFGYQGFLSVFLLIV